MKNLLVESMQLNNSSLLELQKLFRNGIIKENDIPKEQLHELKNYTMNKSIFWKTP